MSKYLFVCVFLLCISVKPSAQSWKQFADSAKLYQEQKKPDQAILHFKKAINALLQDSAFSLSIADLKDKLGTIYYRQNKYDEALPLCRESKQIREKLLGKDDVDYATSCNSLGVSYLGLGEYDSAQLFLHEAERIRKSLLGNENFIYTETSSYLGFLYYNMLEYEKAVQYFLETGNLIKKFAGEEHPDYIQACNMQGLINMDMGRYKLAEFHFTIALNIVEKVYGRQSSRYAFYVNNLSVANKRMGRYGMAEQLYLTVMDVYEKLHGKESVRYAQICNNLGNLYMSLGQYRKAEDLHKQGKDIYFRLVGKDDVDYSTSCENLGQLYRDTEDYNKAVPLYQEALRIMELNYGNDHPEYARVSNGIGTLYSDMGSYSLALPYFLNALNIRGEKLGRNHPDYAETCTDLGELYANTGDYEKALVLLHESLVIVEKTVGKNHVGYVSNIFCLANTNALAGRYKEAYDYYFTAFRLTEELISEVFAFTNETEKQLYLEEIGQHISKFNSFNALAAISNQQGFAYNLNLASRNRILFSSEKLKQAVINSTDPLLTLKFNEWIESREQLAFWLTQPKEDRQGRDSLYENKAGLLEKELTRLYEPFKNMLAKPAAGWKEIQAVLKKDEAVIEFSTFTLFEKNQRLDSSYYIAWVITSDHEHPRMVRLFEKSELEQLLSLSGSSPGEKRVNFIYSNKRSALSSKSIFELVWKPLENMLQGKNTVYFAPAGLLHKVSFAAVVDDKENLISNKYKLVQLSTTASVIHYTSLAFAPGDKIRLYGGIQYDADSSAMRKYVLKQHGELFVSRSLPEDLNRDGLPEFQVLAGAAREMIMIRDLYTKNISDISIAGGLEATEESFKSLSGDRSPKVIHIATHGFFFPDPNHLQAYNKTVTSVFRDSDNPLIRSGLAFAGANNAWKGKRIKGIEDGILTAFEVSNLYLPNTKLAVLSACETGLGDIQGSEGVYGLQRAFRMAGVENLIMSLWKVPDAETAEFMAAFYRNLFGGKNSSDSFYEAQTLLKNKYRGEPYKWAAWILVH